MIRFGAPSFFSSIATVVAREIKHCIPVCAQLLSKVFFETLKIALLAPPWHWLSESHEIIPFRIALSPLKRPAPSSLSSAANMPSSTIGAIDASAFNCIPDTIRAFRNGEFVVVLDDPGRENEADLIIAAEAITTEQMAFMIRHSSGLICAPILPQRTLALQLPQMVEHNEDPRTTAYTISIDAADASVTTGISAHDRALTCRVLASDTATPASFRRPGHVFPLRAKAGGVRQRRGHTEAAIDLCRLAGKKEAAVICELVDDGEEIPGRPVMLQPGMLRGEACVAFARKYGLMVCTIADMVAHLEKTEGKLAVNVNGST